MTHEHPFPDEPGEENRPSPIPPSVEIPESETETLIDTVLKITPPADVPQARPTVDFAEHRVPVKSASTPVTETIGRYPGTRVTVDLAEHRVPVKSAAVPSNLSHFSDDSEAVLVLESPEGHATVAASVSQHAALPAVTESTPGALLLRVRSKLKMTLEQVAAQTHIKQEYLNALEHDDLKALPPEVYRTAYVRSLASFYKLSPETREQLITAFKPKPSGDASPSAEKPFVPSIRLRPKIHLIKWAFGAAVAAGLLLVTVLLFSGSTPDNTVSPTMPEPVVDRGAVQTNAAAPRGGFKTEEFQVLYPQYQGLSLGEVPEKR